MPTIAAALDSRSFSALKEERVTLSGQIPSPYSKPDVNPKQISQDCANALYLGLLCAFAQGMAVIASASAEYEWKLNLAEIVRIWKGGCIIRGKILSRIEEAFNRRPDLPTLLMDEYVTNEISARHGSLRRISTLAIAWALPCPALLSCVGYIDSMACPRLPTFLIQAQRDFFGAHTYERTDRSGSFHTHWNSM